MSVSIIIPTYINNSQTINFFESTFNSILDLNMETQIIIADDFSPEEYQKKILHICKENRFEYIKLTQKGLVGGGRNAGLKLANKSFVFFLDADDLIIREAFEELYNFAQKSDFDVVAGNIKQFGNLASQHPLANFECNTHEGVIKKFTDYSYDVICCAKFYRRDFLERNNFKFLNNTYHEDIPFSLKVCLTTSKICKKENIVYAYRRHNSSITKDRSLTQKHINDYCLVIDEILKTLVNDQERVSQSITRQIIQNHIYAEFLPKLEIVDETDDLFEKAKSAIDWIKSHPLIDHLNQVK